MSTHGCTHDGFKKLTRTSVKRERLFIHPLERFLHSNDLGIRVRHLELREIKVVNSVRIDDVPIHVFKHDRSVVFRNVLDRTELVELGLCFAIQRR